MKTESTESRAGVASAAPCSALSALAFSLADKIDELRKVESSAFLRPAHEMAIRLAHELCNHENSSFRVGIRISEPNDHAHGAAGAETNWKHTDL